MKLKIFIFILFFTNSLSFAQTSDEQMQKQIDEFLKYRDQVLNSFFSDDFENDIEQRMLQMMQNFGGWPDVADMMGGAALNQNEWSHTETHRVLKLKVKQIKDRPLDIKIEKGMINIKGDAELSFGNSKNIVKFERSYSIPKDVDQTSPEFENNDSEIIIKFKFLKDAIKPKVVKPVEQKPKEKTPVPDRMPIGPSDSGLSL